MERHGGCNYKECIERILLCACVRTCVRVCVIHIVSDRAAVHGGGVGVCGEGIQATGREGREKKQIPTVDRRSTNGPTSQGL